MSRRLYGRVELRGGAAYFLHSEPMFSEPVLVRSLWRMDSDASIFEAGQPVTLDLDRNAYVIDRGVYGEMVIAAGWDGPADIVETEDIPRPKTKLATRWNGGLGRWQKQTARGWR